MFVVPSHHPKMIAPGPHPTPYIPHLNIDNNSLNYDNSPERNRETLN